MKEVVFCRDDCSVLDGIAADLTFEEVKRICRKFHKRCMSRRSFEEQPYHFIIEMHMDDVKEKVYPEIMDIFRERNTK